MPDARKVLNVELLLVGFALRQVQLNRRSSFQSHPVGSLVPPASEAVEQHRLTSLVRIR